MPDGGPSATTTGPADATAGEAGLPARLRQARREAGLSQAEAGGDALSASYVSLLESGRRRPTDAALAVLAERLGCTVDYLVHGQDPADLDRIRLTLDYADLALRNGEPVDALTQLDAVAGDLGAVSESERWRHRRAAGQDPGVPGPAGGGDPRARGAARRSGGGRPLRRAAAAHRRRRALLQGGRRRLLRPRRRRAGPRFGPPARPDRQRPARRARVDGARSLLRAWRPGARRVGRPRGAREPG